MVTARFLVPCVLACALNAALAQSAPPAQAAPAAAPASAAAPSGAPGRPAENTMELDEVSRLIRAGKLPEALVLADAVVQSYEDRYRRGTRQVFSSRSPVESQAYLSEVGRTPSPGKEPTEAGMYPSTWCDAYYLQSFILTELKRPA